MTDYKHSADGDIEILCCDISLADTWTVTGQHERDILLASPGDYKESPLTGVGLIDSINDNDGRDMLRDISMQLRQDGMRIAEVTTDERGQILIDGTYENSNGRS